ncbi:MAG: aminotransferase class IV [Saprospiraceae bacterium]|nr:aminotransferase class IV [Pyrinomonadaceae bacterium]
MHEFVSFDREILRAKLAKIQALSSAALYGHGIFTSLTISDGKPFLWERHWHRLMAAAEKTGIDISKFAETDVAETICSLIENNEITNGRARITIFDEATSGVWSFDTGRKTSLLITTADNRKIADKFQLAVSPHRINTTSPLAGIKSCNYLEHLMAFDEAKVHGFDEAVRLNERGEVASACMANVFWLKGGRLFTPSLKTGCLAGTTREFILENIECEEVKAGEEAIREADEIFLTSAGIGVVQVAEFDGRAMRRNPHGILDIVPKPI